MKDEKAMMNAVGSIAISLLIIDFYRKDVPMKVINMTIEKRKNTHTHTHISPLYPLKSLNIKEENRKLD